VDFESLRDVLRGSQPGTGATLLLSGKQVFETLELCVYLVAYYRRIECGSEGFLFVSFASDGLALNVSAVGS
jgi:hypothetical protein